MVAIRLPAVVTQDRQLIVKLPDEIAPGEVEIVIHTQTISSIANLTRETARAKLAAAGLLSTAHRVPEGAIIPTDEEARAAGILPPGARGSEELINEDREER